MHPTLKVLVAIFVTTLANHKFYQYKLSMLDDLHRQASIKECMEGWTRGFKDGELEGRRAMWLEHLTDPKAPWYKSES